MKIRGRIYSVILVLLLVFFVWLRGVQDLQPSQGSNQPSIGTGMQKETLYVWYTDEALTDYMNSMALSYMEAQYQDRANARIRSRICGEHQSGNDAGAGNARSVSDQ